MTKRGRTKPEYDFLEAAERQLFPTRPYHYLTREQREQAYELAKEMILQKTGRRIP